MVSYLDVQKIWELDFSMEIGHIGSLKFGC